MNNNFWWKTVPNGRKPQFVLLKELRLICLCMCALVNIMKRHNYIWS